MTAALHVIPGAVIDEDVIEDKIRDLAANPTRCRNRVRSEVRRPAHEAARRWRPARCRAPSIEHALHRRRHRVSAGRDRPPAQARRAPRVAVVRRERRPADDRHRASKNRSADAIDCAVAAAMAIGRAAKGEGGSVYDDIGGRKASCSFNGNRAGAFIQGPSPAADGAARVYGATHAGKMRHYSDEFNSAPYIIFTICNIHSSKR